MKDPQEIQKSPDMHVQPPQSAEPSRGLQILVFFGLALLAIAFSNEKWGGPPLALLLGLIVGLTVKHPYAKANSGIIKKLLQYAVIGLGFGIPLTKVIQASQTGLVMAVCTIVATLVVGYWLGRGLKIPTRVAYLISAGTAICGGSAIAAVGPVLDADDSEMSVSLGTVFILNGIALLIFPLIGHFFHMSEAQFGLWAAIAIHDTSSVVGAAKAYGPEALMIATTVKLARALWVVPLVFLTAWLFNRQPGEGSGKIKKVALPFFILYFVLASVLRTYVPVVAQYSEILVHLAKLGLTVTLFLIGAGLSVDGLRQVGVRPLVFGVTLWLLVAGVSLCGLLWMSVPVPH
jgi:uncharacterized integral membrane protein (TIGR00698 family)